MKIFLQTIKKLQSQTFYVNDLDLFRRITVSEKIIRANISLIKIIFFKQEWKNGQQSLGRTHRYVWNASDFNSVNPATTDSILGKKITVLSYTCIHKHQIGCLYNLYVRNKFFPIFIYNMNVSLFWDSHFDYHSNKITVINMTYFHTCFSLMWLIYLSTSTKIHIHF